MRWCYERELCEIKGNGECDSVRIEYSEERGIRCTRWEFAQRRKMQEAVHSEGSWSGSDDNASMKSEEVGEREVRVQSKRAARSWLVGGG